MRLPSRRVAIAVAVAGVVAASSTAAVFAGGGASNPATKRPTTVEDQFSARRASTWIVLPSPRPTGGPAASATRRLHAAAATRVMRRHGALLAGTIDPEAVLSVDECTPRHADDLLDCWFGQGVGGEDPQRFRVRLEPDGTLAKQLGPAGPVPGTKSPTQTAALLDADDDLQHAPSRSRDYACRRSPRLDPDGSRSRSGGTGAVCTTSFRVSRTSVRRYVEFAPDGLAIRDYVLHAR